MLTDETKPSDFKKSEEADYSHIKGWGIDADPENDPVYPMKNRTNEEHEGYAWERPEQQNDNVEMLKSVERPNLTAVFGTASPPEGLNGKLRRFAFKYSESSYGRWLPLVLADRVGEICTERIQHPVREIRNIEDFEHQRQSEFHRQK